MYYFGTRLRSNKEDLREEVLVFRGCPCCLRSVLEGNLRL